MPINERMTSAKKITRSFNIVLFLYLCFMSMIDYLFSPESDSKIPWEEVYKWSPIFANITAFILLFIIVFWGSILTKIFWNRFISNVFSVRTITFDESTAIVLILLILWI